MTWKKSEEYFQTTNPSVYKKIRATRLADGLEGKTYMSCDYCKPHRGHNKSNKNRKGEKPKNGYDDNRKFKTESIQYHF